MRKKRERLIKIIAAVLAATMFCGIAGSGLLDIPDGVVSDALYQHETYTDGEIIVVGMDQRALDVLGPMPWSRSVMAQAIEYLNSDPQGRKPAVIGIDTLYVGESGDPVADAALVKAVRDGGNVVVAAAATFGSELQFDGDDFYMAQNQVQGWDEPYAALKKVAEIGHINAMEDTDAILRHALLSVEVAGEGRVYSFARVIYEKYCAVKGLQPKENPPANQGFYYMPYTTRGGGYYDGISVADLVQGMQGGKNIDPAFFAGKIVLIGPYTVGMQDSYRTSIDHAAPMYGVEFQANAIDAFRNGFYPVKVSERVQLILLFVICFGMLLFFYDRRVISAVLVEIGAVLLWIVVCFATYRGGFILHVIWVPLFVTVLFVASVALNYIRAAREKRRVQNTFGHYVDPGVMKELLEQGSSALELGGKMYDIAVLFVDVRGFTTMSEALEPTTVVEIVNRYLTLTTECIMKNHGILDKFVGDCTMAFWNAPVAQEDAVYLACCAAMDMVEGSRALGEELQKRFGRSVSFGIGVNWGPAVVGNIGAPLRMDYTAIGDTVNTAARLEANAPGGQILISRAVADVLGDRAKVTSLGDSIRLKGKAEGFEILRLDALVR
ncbi:MAG: adenylate/guanylate cyclase domain-containing protein [Lachnospiraceae bacterium]|nr:adenylate/guanylate cyclase domain-containing protein [Lachnospiraceae bacterium]